MVFISIFWIAVVTESIGLYWGQYMPEIWRIHMNAAACTWHFLLIYLRVGQDFKRDTIYACNHQWFSDSRNYGTRMMTKFFGRLAHIGIQYFSAKIYTSESYIWMMVSAWIKCPQVSNEVDTIECGYNRVQNDKILHYYLQELRQNINQVLDPQKTSP